MLETLGDPVQAEASYQRALAANPEGALSHYSLARLWHLGGKLDDADRGYREALARDPNLAEAHFNLGRLLLERGDASQAEAELRNVLRLDPSQAGAQSYLGDALFAQRRMVEALDAYDDAAEREPTVAATQFDVGKVLEFLSRHDEAIDRYRRCIVLEPTSVAAREGLARALQAAGRTPEAIASVEEWLSLTPGQPIAQHLLASLGAREAPARASDAYVRDTFDRFAPDFDATLGRLQYQAPHLLVAGLELARGAPHGDLAILDAGCGTGLCGPLLKPFASRLEGVDLSRAMLDRAWRGRGYDHLHEGELTHFIAGYMSSWDAIVSADTLCYFGDLAPISKVSARALRPGGVLTFTLERLEPLATIVGETGGAMGSRPARAAPGYALGPHGRYAHSENYVRETLEAAGFEVTMGNGVLRHEGGKPVEGLIVVARVRG
jgi:predicted TPR repeat methyltransferase